LINNNNNNDEVYSPLRQYGQYSDIQDNLYGAARMLKALQEFAPVHVMYAAQRQVAVNLYTKPIGFNHYEP